MFLIKGHYGLADIQYFGGFGNKRNMHNILPGNAFCYIFCFCEINEIEG